jgi:hypothetical protein
MSETPEQRKARWDAYIAFHQRAADQLRADKSALEPAVLRDGLARLHEGIAVLASFTRDKDLYPVDPMHPEYHKVRQTHLYNVAAGSFQAASEFALNATRSIILVNGGALVAVLAFFGAVDASPALAGGISAASLWFVAGLIFALLTLLGAYMTQSHFGRAATCDADKIYFSLIGDRKLVAEEDKEADEARGKGDRWEVLAIGYFVVAAASFVGGAFTGLKAIAAG